MSAKQLLRLAVIFGILLLVWGAAALARRLEKAPGGSDAFRLPTVARSAADTVMLARPGDTVVLAKKDSSTWTVNGHPAGPQAISDLFAAWSDSTSGSELVAQQRASHTALGVDSAAGRRVRIRGGGRTLADLVVGRRSPDFSGGYIRRADQEPTYLVRGRLVEVLSRGVDDWRDRRIAAVKVDSVAAIEVLRGRRRYALRRSGSGWVLSPGGPADSARARDLVEAYSSVNATGFASASEAKSARFASPDRRTRLLRKDGTPLVTLLFDSTASGFWVRPDTGKAIYKIDTWNADRLAPADSTLRARPSSSPTK
jgi:hypothetical protein